MFGTVKPAPVKYSRPGTVAEAVEAISTGDAGIKLLAGGQSLVPLLNFRLAQPSVLVDLNLVEGLSTIDTHDDQLVMGSMVRLADAESSERVKDGCPLLVSALHHVGHLQIRNRGTIGGSIAHADPAAELPALMVGLGGQVVAQSIGGRRVIEAADFFVGPFTTALRPDELIVEIRFPNAGGSNSAFVEFSLRRGDFALAGIGVALSFETDSGAVRSARFGALGVGPTPLRLNEAEEVVRGVALTQDVIRHAADAASREVDPLDDIHADAEYRRELLTDLVVRALQQVAA